MAKVPDVPLCTDLGTKGWCRYTISNKSFIVDNDKQLYKNPLTGKLQTWAEMKRISVITPASSWIKIKDFTDAVCHQFGCSNGVGEWSTVVEDITDHLPGAKI